LAHGLAAQAGMALQETFVAAMKATQDVRVAKAARQEAAVDARKAMEVAVKASDTIREVLEAVRASKESAHAELDS
jgi:5S rRNA maturation endonuclease (ribonuclease M5)